MSFMMKSLVLGSVLVVNGCGAYLTPSSLTHVTEDDRFVHVPIGATMAFKKDIHLGAGTSNTVIANGTYETLCMNAELKFDTAFVDREILSGSVFDVVDKDTWKDNAVFTLRARGKDLTVRFDVDGESLLERRCREFTYDGEPRYRSYRVQDLRRLVTLTMPPPIVIE